MFRLGLGSGYGSPPPHLQLSDPGAVPVGLPRQLHEELPLRPALHGGRGRGVGGGVRGRGHGRGGRGLPPAPVEDLLDPPCDWWTLPGREREPQADV